MVIMACRATKAMLLCAGSRVQTPVNRAMAGAEAESEAGAGAVARRVSRPMGASFR
ncbi:hypothetical protein [Streptomyces sp. NWU339]|uniref:hypothetical protein n=1 Tax=Streptomyces sp. NWU339 TaxID=2185284 RepID=UPI00215B5D34|nr:hypothetical protein [Streptomyces sp. NWU339]